MSPHDWLIVALNGSQVPPKVGMMLAGEGLMYLPEGSKMYLLTEKGEEAARARKDRTKPKRLSDTYFCIGCQQQVGADHACPAAASYIDPEPEPSKALDGAFMVRMIWDRPEISPEGSSHETVLQAFEFFTRRILKELQAHGRVRLELDVRQKPSEET